MLQLFNKVRNKLGRSIYKRYNNKKPTGYLKKQYIMDLEIFPSKNTKYSNIKVSIVSAVYNVERYIDRFIVSIINQTISFEDNIELILIDDGSTDSTPKICQKWQKLFPINIKYARKENAGVASARNYGISLASHDWITFCDPDDFLKEDYFEKVLIDLESTNTSIDMIVCKCVQFYENSLYYHSNGLFSIFPLTSQVLNYYEDKIFNFFAHCSILKRDIIIQNKIYFDNKVKPTFEDGHFIAKYIHYSNRSVLFCADSWYFYRKRIDISSLVDTSWEKKEQYSSKLEYGFLDTLKFYKHKLGYVPTSIQNKILYDSSWYFNALVGNYTNHKYKVIHENNLHQDILPLLKQIYSYLDIENILSPYQNNLHRNYKIGMLKLLKDYKISSTSINVEKYDHNKELLKITFASAYKDNILKITNNGKIIKPETYKARTHKFIDNDFFYEHIYYINLKNLDKIASLYFTDTSINKILSISIDNSPINHKVNIVEIVKICIKKQKIKLSIIPQKLVYKLFKVLQIMLGAKNKIFIYENCRVLFISLFSTAGIIRVLMKFSFIKNIYKDAWIFIDRDVIADDNAEHLYEYVQKNHPDKNIYFIIRKHAKDYERLKSKSFKLVNFGSLKHKLLICNAKYLISSHADTYLCGIKRLYEYEDLIKFDFIFLQHGVIKDDISEWLNTVNPRYFITSSKNEHESIADGTNYKFTSNEVKLTGLPRHDKLLRLQKEYMNLENKKNIVIMPTWRSYLLAGKIDLGNARKLKVEEFLNSIYFNTWISLLKSGKLKELQHKYNINIIFCPHFNMEQYINNFNEKELSNISILTSKNVESIQDLLIKADYFNNRLFFYRF